MLVLGYGSIVGINSENNPWAKFCQAQAKIEIKNINSCAVKQVNCGIYTLTDEKLINESTDHKLYEIQKVGPT